MISKHYSNKRYHRQRLIEKRINGDGNVIDCFEINRGHKKGSEIHSVTDTGLILIHNKNTGILVTKLIARPNQIKRYYENSGRNPPEWLLNLAEWHESLNYFVDIKCKYKKMT